MDDSGNGGGRVGAVATQKGVINMLDCHQVLSELSNYLDDDVSLELAGAIAQHLVRCHRCWVIYNTTSRTLQIMCDAIPSSVPIAVSDRLHARLREICANGAANSSGAGPQTKT